MKKTHLFVVIALFILLFGYLFRAHQAEWGKLPNGMHTWSQSDHFALTEGFVENNLDFFHPQTHVFSVYNQEYPKNWKTADSTTITSIDFPVHQYLPAVFMKIAGSNSPVFSQWYAFLLGFIGLIFLFRLAYLFNRSVITSFVITCFACLAPVCFYYNLRFIPSVPSLSCAVIGMYYYFRYRKAEHERKWLVLFVVFLTLAALSRMTFLVPMLSVFFVELVRLIRYRNDVKRKLLTAVVALAVFVGYYAYNQYLINTYGTLFLNGLNPAKSFTELQDVLLAMFDRWKFDYLTKYHYGFLALLFLFFVWSLFRRKTKVQLPYNALLVGTLIAGALAFFVAMSAQFVNHDYYFIDTFMLPMIVVMCMLSTYVPLSHKIGKWAVIAVMIVLTLGMARSNRWVQELRVENERLGGYQHFYDNFKNGDQLLDELHIGQNDRLLVLSQTAPNYPFQLLKRKGYLSLKNAQKDLDILFRMPFDYVIFQNDWFMKEIIPNNPEIIHRLRTIGNNGRISVCKIESAPEQNIFTFFQLNKKVALYSADMSGKANHFTNRGKQTQPGDTVWHFDEKDFSGPLFHPVKRQYFNQSRMLWVEGEVQKKKGEQLLFVTSKAEDGVTTFYEALPINDPDESGWTTIQFLVSVPAATGKSVDFGAYIYNVDHHRFSIKNLSVKLY